MADKDLGSLYAVTKSAGVQDVWEESDPLRRRVTGKGVGVALIDSGVTPVPGLDASKIVNGPDLSFESQDPATRNVDTFGHGTHMAGIIAGRDPGLKDSDLDTRTKFVGVAPDATLLNMKVATHDGAVDVSQVIAAIDWVVAHRDDPGLNIRVINLSYGTDGTQSYVIDPLAYAVENAWRHGIVVVVAAGNDGNTTESLTNPAIDPYVIAVGAADHRGTYDRRDDTVATFSSRGSVSRTPDLVAPGRSLVSLRDPGSTIDTHNPTAVVTDAAGPRLFRGSGTSQAAAFTSGTAALLLQDRPTLTPDQVKALLTTTADPIANTDRRLQGAGLIDVDQAIETRTPLSAAQTFPFATGTGSLEAARGTSHVADPDTGEELTGEQDIFGQPWDGRSWAEAAWNGRSWAGAVWNGSTWTGTEWQGRSWASVAWTGRSWAGRSWAGRSWAGRSWAGRSWAGRAWASVTTPPADTDKVG
jgi:serine protease AprX